MTAGAKSLQRQAIATEQFMKSPGQPMAAPSMKGDAAMTQGIIAAVVLMGLVGLEICQWNIGVPWIIVWVLLMGMLGLVWAIGLNIFDDDIHPHDDQQGGSLSSDPHDGEKPHEHSSRQPKVAA